MIIMRLIIQFKLHKDNTHTLALINKIQNKNLKKGLDSGLDWVLFSSCIRYCYLNGLFMITCSSSFISGNLQITKSSGRRNFSTGNRMSYSNVDCSNASTTAFDSSVSVKAFGSLVSVKCNA